MFLGTPGQFIILEFIRSILKLGYSMNFLPCKLWEKIAQKSPTLNVRGHEILGFMKTRYAIVSYAICMCCNMLQPVAKGHGQVKKWVLLGSVRSRFCPSPCSNLYFKEFSNFHKCSKLSSFQIQ